MSAAGRPSLVDGLDQALPQTQCTRCGFADCRSYAQALADGSAEFNRCPPGGAEGIGRISRIGGRPALPLDPACGVEAPRGRAVIDEAWCIGCTLCIAACPVDCIVGASKRMHTVIAEQCTGCELCLPACPVDCISLLPASGQRTGWDAWSAEQASASRRRYLQRQSRAASDATPRDGPRLEAPAASDELHRIPAAAGLQPGALLAAALARAAKPRQSGER